MTSRSEVAPPPHPAAATMAMTTQRPRRVMRPNPRWKPLAEARRFAADLASKGGTILFVGTKKQARDAIKEWAERCEMPYVNQRWLGGLLTNFQTISARIERLHELTELRDEGQLDLLPTKERMAREAELAKLEYNLGGVRNMQRLPQAAVIIDLKTKVIAARAA